MFFLFLADFNQLFLSKLSEKNFVDSQQMYNNNNDDNDNVKSFLEIFFWGFSQQFSKINVLLWKKLYCIQPLWCTASLDKFYTIYLVLTKKMAQISSII